MAAEVSKRPRPLVLIVIDGWGINPNSEGNAIALSKPPTMTRLWQQYPHTQLGASGLDVGLPQGQQGNSEVGHLNIGAGFVVYQDITRIDKAIADGDFERNEVLRAACAHAHNNDARLHVMGLLGPGGVHSHWQHLFALARLAEREGVGKRVRHHFFLDGRDTPPQSALGFVDQAMSALSETSADTVSTVSGRYYAMDRDNRWERVQMAYDAIVEGQGKVAPTPQEAVSRSYADGVNDEFVLPTIIAPDGTAQAAPEMCLQSGDAVIFYNFRTDRGRELTKAIVIPTQTGLSHSEPLTNLYYVTMTEYEKDLPVNVAFPAEDVAHPLAQVISAAGLRQFHTAETEKYAHVTFFINGGREDPFPGEDRQLVASPQVATYDLKPEMSAREVTNLLLTRIKGGEYDFCVVNYANPDMVGHTGILAAAEQAVLVTDECIGRVVDTVLPLGGLVIITADHGNAEQEVDYITGQPMTSHTTAPVPFILVSNDPTFQHVTLRDGGRLADVAPTILDIMGLPKPGEMTGTSLIVL